MHNNKLHPNVAMAVLTGCTTEQEKACQEEEDVAKTVMDVRLKQGQIANATFFLAGNNEALREQLRPIIHDAFEYERGGLATFDATKQMFREKYYQQYMNR